jgi:hypothetical protein
MTYPTPAFERPSSWDGGTMRAGAREPGRVGSRTDLARRREPSIHAGFRVVARSGRERSRGVCSTRQQQSPGAADTARGADTRRNP